MTSAADYLALLRRLRDAGVDFIVVGGVAAVLQGAPVSTFDLDIVHARTDANIARLLAALQALDAFYRTAPERKLRCTAAHLASDGHQLLLTRFGPLDLLGTVSRSISYEQLLPHSEEVQIASGLSARVLSLDKQIEFKRELAGDKDRAMLAILEATRAEKGS